MHRGALSELPRRTRSGQWPKSLAHGPAPRDARRHAELRGVPVLIVEHDRSDAKVLFVALTDEGCDVRVTGSAEEALAILTVFVPPVVVVDLVLPKMSGLLFAQTLKREAPTNDTVVIAMASFSDVHAKQLALDAGCATYFEKPIDTEAVVALVARDLCMLGERPGT